MPGRDTKTRYGLPVTSAIMVSFGSLVLSSALAADTDLAAKARDVIAAATGQPAEQLISGSETRLANTAIWRFKFVDRDGAIRGVALDSLGNQVDEQEVQHAIAALSRAQFPDKIETALAERMHTRAGAHNVVLWLKDPGASAPRSRESAGIDGPDRLAEVRDRVAALHQSVADELGAIGQPVVYQGRYAPAVVVSADNSAIHAMAGWDAVERIYLERVYRPRLNVSKLATGATTVHAKGFTGAGVKVAVVEAGRVAAHANLPATQRIRCRPTASTAIAGHKTQVAGVIQSNHAPNKGTAPGVILIDGIAANFGGAELMAATDCVINAGAVAVNMSFGVDTNGFFDAFARYVDAVVYNTGRTIVVAVSNACGLRMGTPEIAFNALSVGSFSDRNTTALGDDVHSCSTALSAGTRHSAFLDPVSPFGDREEPDLVAPGHFITTTNAAGGFSSVVGTSFAAPHVTGGVALLNSRRLVNSEEARAILMASARHNIEGAARLSERDGAGGLRLNAADRLLVAGQSFVIQRPGGTTGFPVHRTFDATAGQRVRVVLTWAHKTPLGDTMTEPTTDLDLQVLQPGGALLRSSLSADNSYEIVEFTAPVTGTYTARIINFRASAGTEYIALAVSR